MSAFTFIELDTTPPELEVGNPVRPSLDLVEVPYSLSDGIVISARLRLLDEDIEMSVFADKVAIGILSSVPSQLAYIEVTARDDVWNSVTKTVEILITGSSADIAVDILKIPDIDYEILLNPRMNINLQPNPGVLVEFEQHPYVDAKIILDPEESVE